MKSKLTILVFFVIIFGFFFMNLIVPDEVISKSERRTLAQFPKNIKNISNDFENYATDQFFRRDEFRTIKNYTEFFMFGKSDVHSLSLYENGIIKHEQLQEKSVVNASKKINKVYEKYLEGMNVFYVIVPDKSCYIKDKNYPKYTYNQISNIAEKNIEKNIKKIDIYKDLDYESYYKTDSHWRQEKIISTANKILQQLKKGNLEEKYDIKQIKDFYGVYYGQLQVEINPDVIYYLTNDIIENAKVYNFETKETTKVYDMKKINSMDKYDIFLSGATALLEITNDEVKNSEEIIIFRDSFGSSVIPLLIEKYNKITVIDLRYISSELLEKYIKFENQDVLFLYSTMLYNNSYSLK